MVKKFIIAGAVALIIPVATALPAGTVTFQSSSADFLNPERGVMK